MRRGLAIALTALVSGVLTGCGGGDPSGAASEGASDGAELAVMSFNVWYGGGSVDAASIGRAIDAADADVVGLQEPEGNTRRIAQQAGMAFADPSLHLISRYPIYPAERDGVRFGYVEVSPGEVVAVANTHLPSTPYGPYEVRDGASAEEVVGLERRTRLPEARPYARVLAALAGEDVPVFLTGDMNSPSHLDSTEIEWPVSKAFADAGLRDSYREVHPDPLAVPAPTWTPGRPPPFKPDDETSDRIDWVLAGGPAEALDSRLVGEPGGPDVEVEVDPWGSDHRAVASTFATEPAPAPALVAAEPAVVERGDPVAVRYTLGDSGAGTSAAIVPARGAGKKPLVSLPLRTGHDHVAPNLGTATVDPGSYRAALLGGDGELIATTPLWIEQPGAAPRVKTSRDAYAPGETITASWTAAPGNKYDWVGIYPAGEPSVYAYEGFFYTAGRADGRLAIDRSELGRLAPGDYEVRLVLDDGYAALAVDGFEVAASRSASKR